MKKNLFMVLIFLLVSLLIIPGNTKAQSTGLLDGKTVKIASNQFHPIGTTTAVTDQDSSTQFLLKGQINNSSIPDYLVYDFAEPVEISGFKVQINDFKKENLAFEFYDKDNKQIYGVWSVEVVGDDLIYYFTTPIKNVTKAVLTNPNTTDLKIAEWNLYNSSLALVAEANSNQITLTWNQQDGAKYYTIERSLIPGGPYSTIASNVTTTTYGDTNVESGTKYYYIVNAFDSVGVKIISNEASAELIAATSIPSPSPIPDQSTGERAILVVTLNIGLEKEFDLSMDEVNAFIAWYENKQAGAGTASYAIDKHDNNKGPFTSRKDYVIFDKILTFEVNEYTVTE